MMREVLRICAVVLLLPLLQARSSAAEPHWPAVLTLGTASPGGTYFAYGEGLAQILTRALGILVVARPTEGPGQNMLLLESGEIQLGLVTLGVALQGWNGSASWTGGRQLRAMRAMFPMYDTPFQFMVPDASPAKSLAGLNGLKMGIGPQGGTTATYVPAFFQQLKIDASLVPGEWAELAKQVEAGALDGLAVAAGVPFPSFLELERKIRVRYLPVEPQQVLDLRFAMPELGVSTVGAGSYPSLRRNYPTVGLYNFAVAHKDLPADLVAAIVDAVFANHDALVEIHPAAAETVPENFTRNTFLPFHDGASRWYYTRGVLGVTRGD